MISTSKIEYTSNCDYTEKANNLESSSLESARKAIYKTHDKVALCGGISLCATPLPHIILLGMGIAGGLSGMAPGLIVLIGLGGSCALPIVGAGIGYLLDNLEYYLHSEEKVKIELISKRDVDLKRILFNGIQEVHEQAYLVNSIWSELSNGQREYIFKDVKQLVESNRFDNRFKVENMPNLVKE